ncbi:RHS repeat-associated core domain-containing protein [Flagellimonas beolgyonensis]|uniref:RHS repeat-associated core domain-containing protein n=1 Tax=Flagellimonas beolgyonensis TaxID=864064 RepID=UPI003D65838A
MSKIELEKSRSYTSCGFSISYVYDAAGTKLEKSAGGSVTLYAGNYIYQNGALQFFSHAEGYASPNGLGGYDYVYQYKDHLGNIRLSYTDGNGNGNGSIDPNAEIVEESNYYPFGLKHKGYNTATSPLGNDVAQKWKFGGKEYDDSFDINTYDFGWRDYDPAIARWTVVDPLGEKKYEWTPYNYVQNSPIFRFDPDGLTDFTLNRRTGEVAVVKGTETDDGIDRIVKTKKDGEIKRKKNGEAKVAINDIAQGILSDGMNLRDNSNLIAVGGEGQPTSGDVESFALKLSDYVGKEIGGSYFSTDGDNSVSHLSLGAYAGNKYDETTNHGTNLRGLVANAQEAARYTLRGVFHTHPGRKGGFIADSDRLVPSRPDREFRDNALRSNPSLFFILLTHPENIGGDSPRRLDFTIGYPAADR